MKEELMGMVPGMVPGMIPETDSETPIPGISIPL